LLRSHRRPTAVVELWLLLNDDLMDLLLRLLLHVILLMMLIDDLLVVKVVLVLGRDRSGPPDCVLACSPCATVLVSHVQCFLFFLDGVSRNCAN
jgi:hypothetical protein